MMVYRTAVVAGMLGLGVMGLRANAQTTVPVAATTPAAAPAVARAATSPAEAAALARPWFDRAMVEGKQIAGVNDRLPVLGQLSQLYARAGDVEQYRATLDALDQANAAADKDMARGIAMYRYGGATELLPALVRAGRLEDARQVLDEVPHDHDNNYRAGAEQVYARVLAEYGHVDEADALVREANQKDAAQLNFSIAMGLARAGDVSQTQAAVADLDVKMRPAIELMLVEGLLRKGDLDAANKAIAAAPADVHEQIMHAVFVRQLKGKDFAGARKTIDQLKGGGNPDRAFLDLCFAQVQAGDLEGAKATALQTVGQTQEQSTIALVTREMVKAGDEQGAADFVEQMKPKDLERARMTLRQTLVMASADANDGRRAAMHWVELADKERLFTLTLAVARAQGAAHDEDGYHKYLAEAIATADGDDSKAYRATEYRQIVAMMAQHGDIDGALATAKKLKDPKDQSASLSSIATGCAVSGDLARAWSLIATIPDERDRITAACMNVRPALLAGQGEKLVGWIAALPGARERSLADQAAGEFYVPPHGLD